MRVVGPRVRAAVTDWIDAKNDEDPQHMKTVLGSLKSLPVGQGWLYSPGWLQTLKRVTFRPIHTFDTHRTPRPGDKPITAQRAAAVDIEDLGQQMAALADQAREDDPKTLRARIAAAERRALHAETQLAAAHEQPAPVQQIPFVPDPLVQAIRTLQHALEQLDTDLEAAAQTIQTSHSRAHAAAAALTQALTTATDSTSPGAPHHRAAHRRMATPPISQTTSAARVTPPTASAPSPDRRDTRKPGASGTAPTTSPDERPAHVKAGARRILETLARHHPLVLTKAQLGTLAKFKITGGTFGTYWSQLKRLGLVEEAGREVRITTAGLDFVGATTAGAMSTEEILEQWRTALKAGARQMLDELVSTYPGALTRTELADRVNMAAGGGTFGTYLSTLRRNNLIEVDADSVRAAGALFLDTDTASRGK